MAIDPACNALTTVARLRAAGFGGTATEDALQLAINAVSAMVERECDRVFREVTYGGGCCDEPAEVLQGSGRRLLLLSTYPIMEVLSVKVDGHAVTDWRLLPDQARWGALYRPRGWPRREGSWGALVADPDGEPDYNIEVSYRGGWDEVPADLELAVMQEVDAVAGGSGAGGNRRVTSERTAGGWAFEYADTKVECSLSARRVFASYKRRDL